jgi:hypothetical protein
MANARRADYRRNVAQRRRAGLLALGSALALGLMLAGCSGGSSGLGAGGDNDVGLASVPWCDQPLMSFQDDGTTAQKTISDWSQVKDQLGFTPYLPATLPKGTCLALAGGSIHDPVFGGKFSVTYVLPGSGALAFSEAPKRANISEDLQCISSPVPGTTPSGSSSTPTATSGPSTPTATPQAAAPTICQGIVQNTSVTVVGRQSASDLKNLYNNLQGNVTWVPTSSLHPATPSPSATAAK